jgi:hypothetical protein
MERRESGLAARLRGLHCFGASAPVQAFPARIDVPGTVAPQCVEAVGSLVAPQQASTSPEPQKFQQRVSGLCNRDDDRRGRLGWFLFLGRVRRINAPV